MANLILADSITSISEFKKNPLAAVEQGQGFPVAVLNRNQPAFYCVPAEAYELLMGKLEDMELSALVSARKDQREVEFNIDDLEPAA
jgi:antitoxin StbD|tara:strand:+ start:917 stop:1177 length:261 start_codon:yes stop_codon:yes gene_type:complete